MIIEYLGKILWKIFGEQNLLRSFRGPENQI